MKCPALLAPLMLITLAACGQEPQLRISDGWVRLAAAPGRPAAAYFTVHGGPTPARLISVDSSVVVRAEMHETTSQGGAMRMRPIENVAIPAEGQVQFAPGGKHVMFFNVNPGIKPGSAMPMIFTFADGTRIQYNARAQAAGAPRPKNERRRALTADETALAASVFAGAIDYARVRIHNRKWAFFQPPNVTMAPMGHIHFHPAGRLYCDDFCTAPLSAQGLFIHEMTHVWQAQQRGRYWLPLMRHPFCRYDYALKPGRPFDRYGIEQQAEIVRHAFLIERGAKVPGAPDAGTYRALLPFRPAAA